MSGSGVFVLPLHALHFALIMTIESLISNSPTLPCAIIYSKQYVLLSVLLCLLASGLVFFFLFPHSVRVDDNGIKVVKVTFNKQDSLVVLHVMVRHRASLPGLCICQPRDQEAQHRSPLLPLPGHPENQKLQLLLRVSDQPVQPGSIHERRGWHIHDH